MSMPSKMDPNIRANFKEEARRIVSADRAANRSGRSQNTIGEIERAMVRAYKLGQQTHNQVAESAKQNDVVDWIVLPPRSRDVLMYMTFSFSSFRSKPTYVADRLIFVDQKPKPRWYSVNEEGHSANEIGFLDGPVQKLIKLKLLEPCSADANVFELSTLGIQTCKSYWQRSDENDPTLPIMSVRR